MMFILFILQNFHHLFTIQHYQTTHTQLLSWYGHIMHHFYKYLFQMIKKVIYILFLLVFAL